MPRSSIFQPIEPSRISDEAVRQIRALIEDGVFKPNDRLPSERQLVQELSVSRTSVREALRVLEAMGFIEVQPGVGAYVLDRHFSKDLSSRWTEWMAEHHEEVDQLLEIREALEPKAAALAAERLTDEKLAAIMQALEKMRKSAQERDIDGAVEADIEFHDLINHAAQNDLLVKLNDSINYVLLESRYAYFQEPERIFGSCEQHQRVVDALKDRDANAASEAMVLHVENTRERMQSVFVSSKESS